MYGIFVLYVLNVFRVFSRVAFTRDSKRINRLRYSRFSNYIERIQTSRFHTIRILRFFEAVIRPRPVLQLQGFVYFFQFFHY